jgi:excisionase family DNA binding protein
MTQTNDDDFVFLPDAARLLGVSQRQLYHLIDEGQLLAYKFGRVIRVRRRDIEAFLRNKPE